MPQQQTLATWTALNIANNPSPSGIASIRTNEAIYAGGLNSGVYFDLTESEANALSATDVSVLHAGRYRWVQVHPNATAPIVGPGRKGNMVPTLIPELNIVTTVDAAPFMTFRPVVFISTVTPGNWGFVQELGIANLWFSPQTSWPPGTMAYVNPADGSWTGTTSVGPGPYGILLESFTATSTGGLVLAMLINVPVLQG